MLVRRFTAPNRSPDGPPPSEGEFERAEAARKRVVELEKEMDDIVNLHCR